MNFLKRIFKNKCHHPPIQLPSQLDLVDPQFVQNPFPFYEELRKKHPVYPVKNGGLLVSRYEDIKAILSDDRFTSSPSRFSLLNKKNSEKYSVADMANHILPFLDRPNHTAPRRIISKCFHPHTKKFQDQLPGYAQKVIQKASKNKPFDLVDEVGEIFSIWFMSDFLGFPYNPQNKEETAKLRNFSEAFFYLFAPFQSAQQLEEANQKIDQFRSYTLPQIQKCRATPDQSLISSLIQTEHEGYFMNDLEIADNCLLLFSDGVENIKYAIGSIFLFLFEKLREDTSLKDHLNTPDKFQNLINEAIRLETPAQFIPRIAAEEIEIHGVKIGKDMPVFLSLASANRDENVFPEASEFTPDRDLSKVLSFGGGRHSCIGGLLGSLQIQTMVKALLESDIKPVQSFHELEYQTRFGHRWPKSINVISTTNGA